MSDDEPNPDVEPERNIEVSDGSRDCFYLSKGYNFVSSVPKFIDTDNRSEWQDNVYHFARTISDEHDYKSILDIGCGSAFKLMKYFSHASIAGVELGETLKFIQQKWPDRTWYNVEEVGDEFPPADLYLLVDVIEHVTNPFELLKKISRSPIQRIIISTPAREFLFSAGLREYWGPPSNAYHRFEWTMHEFNLLVNEHLDIKQHIFHNNGEYSQIVEAVPKR